MNLLLTSAGFSTPKILETFASNLPKPPIENKLIIISIDTTSAMYLNAIETHTNRLISVGLEANNIQIFNLNETEPPTLKEYDVVDFFGGNTYVILDRVRKLGLDKQIRSFIDGGGYYVGHSAGASMLGPEIDVEPYSSAKNEIGLSDICGLNVVDFTVVPHIKVDDDRGRKAIEYQARTEKKMIHLTDKQAIIVKDGWYKLI